MWFFFNNVRLLNVIESEMLFTDLKPSLMLYDKRLQYKSLISDFFFFKSVHFEFKEKKKVTEEDHISFFSEFSKEKLDKKGKRASTTIRRKGWQKKYRDVAVNADVVESNNAFKTTHSFSDSRDVIVTSPQFVSFLKTNNTYSRPSCMSYLLDILIFLYSLFLYKTYDVSYIKRENKRFDVFKLFWVGFQQRKKKGWTTGYSNAFFQFLAYIMTGVASNSPSINPKSAHSKWSERQLQLNEAGSSSLIMREKAVNQFIASKDCIAISQAMVFVFSFSNTKIRSLFSRFLGQDTTIYFYFHSSYSSSLYNVFLSNISFFGVSFDGYTT